MKPRTKQLAQLTRPTVRDRPCPSRSVLPQTPQLDPVFGNTILSQMNSIVINT